MSNRLTYDETQLKRNVKRRFHWPFHRKQPRYTHYLEAHVGILLPRGIKEQESQLVTKEGIKNVK
jgi:hypothetical protein